MPPRKSPQLGLTDTWGRLNRKLADKTCEVCGKSFRPFRASSRFCSRPCMWSKNGGHNKKPASWWANSKGYIEGRIWVGDKKVSVKKHRLVAEQAIGRKLSPFEDVHHINGDKADNRPENLQVISHSDHSRLTNQRDYKRGYELNLSNEERAARAERVRQRHLAGKMLNRRSALKAREG